ncbi:MAG: NCS1 family nucleobase:cation symporter-1 [Fimbriimonas sp.]|nr:NCS1 family nucleobase:cation symporter-1 [Fimbriimonas sp.]
METEFEGGGGLGNVDLDPTSLEQRTWNWVDYSALWIGMAHNIPTWMMAGGLIDAGLRWWQAVLIIALGNLIVLVPILLNSHPGAKYGIPFPIIVRASFGIRGANLATIVRGVIAAVWFGIQVQIGGEALKLVAIRLAPGMSHLNDMQFLGQGMLSCVCYLLFLFLNLWILLHGMASLRRFERWAAPSVLVLAGILFLWSWQQAGGLGPVVSEAPTHAPTNLSHLVLTSLMSVIAFWATLSLNASDFTRFSRSQKDQIVGQTIGLPATMILFSLMGVLTSSATAVIFGKVIWDPVALVQKLPSDLLVIVCLLAVTLATLSVNVAANLVSAAYDISNLAPTKISMARGAVIAAVLGTVIMPWRLLASAHVYIFDWLGNVAIALAPVAGIIIADYWLVRKQHLSVPDLYRTEGAYRYWHGVNPKAVVAAGLGVLAAYSGHFVPALTILSDLSWITGILVALVSYWLLMGKVSAPAS